MSAFEGKADVDQAPTSSLLLTLSSPRLGVPVAMQHRCSYL